MVKWDITNGEMGHNKWRNGIPKWQNGTSQKAKWDIIKGGLDIGGMDNEVE
jgi:hypothetical protein